jgi:hypothetical protein
VFGAWVRTFLVQTSWNLRVAQKFVEAYLTFHVPKNCATMVLLLIFEDYNILIHIWQYFTCLSFCGDCYRVNITYVPVSGRGPVHLAYWNYCWLGVDLPLRKILKSLGLTIPNIWKNKTCSKPPTSMSCHRNCTWKTHNWQGSMDRSCCPNWDSYLSAIFVTDNIWGFPATVAIACSIC